MNLVTEIPDTGISVTWELDNYDVMDIRGRAETGKSYRRRHACKAYGADEI